MDAALERLRHAQSFRYAAAIAASSIVRLAQQDIVEGALVPEAGVLERPTAGTPPGPGACLRLCGDGGALRRGEVAPAAPCQVRAKLGRNACELGEPAHVPVEPAHPKKSPSQKTRASDLPGYGVRGPGELKLFSRRGDTFTPIFNWCQVRGQSIFSSQLVPIIDVAEQN